MQSGLPKFVFHMLMLSVSKLFRLHHFRFFCENCFFWTRENEATSVVSMLFLQRGAGEKKLHFGGK